ncbi:MAG: GNAT family N-acetyltransferase [Candidatus Spyradenecus sp.]
MEFRPLTREVLPTLRPYFCAQRFRLSDYTLGFQLMWLPYAKTAYAEVEGCLLIRSAYGGRQVFDYPLHPEGDPEAELRALAALEAWCVENAWPLVLASIPAERLTPLVRRYGRDLTLSNPRTWRDYLYRFSDFVDYAGKRFAGQRNHVSKFHRLYPTATFRLMTSADLPRVLDFLRAYAERQYAKHSFVANEELHGSRLLLEAFDDLGLCGGLLEHEGTLVAITVGEVVGSTLVVHIEKALVGYEGAYPTIAQAFARALQSPELETINREDDAGDCGLRKSKLQYNPIEILDKYTLTPRRVIETLDAPPEFHAERLTLRPVADADVHAYGRLARDLPRSRLWGWDWRNDWTGEGDPPATWFLQIARQDFERRAELSLGLYLGEEFIGEGVFHNFTYDNTVELGIRLLPEAEGHGYATEAMRAMADYALCYWGLEKVLAKCYRENLPSKRMLLASGLRPDHEDPTFFYFSRTAKN